MKQIGLYLSRPHLERYLEVAFEKHGFFSPDMADFRKSISEDPACKPWFDLCFDLVRQGLATLSTLQTPINDRGRFVISGLFVRAHQSFQAIVILVQNGMIGDARALARTAVEGAIALYALANDPGFIDQLVRAQKKHQMTVANFNLTDPVYRAMLTTDQISQLEADLANLQAESRIPGKELKAIVWEQVAAKHCRDIYHTMYRMFSADGVHAGIGVTQRFYEVEDDRITQLNVGPNASGAVITLAAASFIFLCALEAIQNAYHEIQIAEIIDGFMRRYNNLPQNEPNW